MQAITTEVWKTGTHLKNDITLITYNSGIANVADKRAERLNSSYGRHVQA